MNYAFVCGICVGLWSMNALQAAIEGSFVKFLFCLIPVAFFGSRFYTYTNSENKSGS